MIIVALLVIANISSAQAPQTCDSIVAAARADSIPVGIFVAVRRLDGGMTPEQSTSMALNIGAAFTPPRPLKLSIFGAAPVLRVLRTAGGGDTVPQLRAPNITGVYEVVSTRRDTVPRISVVRTSLIAGFDSAAVDAIRGGAMIREMFAPPADEDSMRVFIRFTTDSAADSHLLIRGLFPRMPVVDAVPRADNPALQFADAARADSLRSGSVVLRFIVGRDGVPEPGTTEVVRFSDARFLRAAAAALPSQRFRPATVRGCPVAQLVDYPMSFFAPETPPHY
jgi:hypothetical protein